MGELMAAHGAIVTCFAASQSCGTVGIIRAPEETQAHDDGDDESETRGAMSHGLASARRARVGS